MSIVFQYDKLILVETNTYTRYLTSPDFQMIRYGLRSGTIDKDQFLADMRSIQNEQSIELFIYNAYKKETQPVNINFNK